MSSVAIWGPAATIVAGVLGLIGGFFSRTGKYWLQKRERRTKLRRALLAELKTPEETINQAAETDTIRDFNPVHSVIPRTVYNTQTDDLGLLSKHEITPVVEYYNIAEVAKEQLDSLDDSDIKEAFLEETAPGLKSARDDAEAVLDSHTRILGGLRYRVRNFVCS
ncbi:hypothetical protein [Halorubrum ezzemoulense]|uniref:hypothetical protein n=1 Tax=Halorubrum ezzemoulense TaxID=337243 RepID=UPI0011408298|nr:hypothetical protein [Halorubrum ezzemoulense]